MQFDLIGVSLRDQDSDSFENYFIDMTSRSELVPKETLTPEETLTLWVYERQEPLLRSTDEMEPRYGRLQAILKRLDIRSICALPLTTAHRRLGAITFCSKQARYVLAKRNRVCVPSGGLYCAGLRRRVEFCGAAARLRELQNNNDRLRLLLDVTNQVVSNLELRDLLSAISQDVRRVMQCDYAGVTLPDAEESEAQATRLIFQRAKGFCRKTWSIRSRSSPSGTAISNDESSGCSRGPFTGCAQLPDHFRPRFAKG